MNLVLILKQPIDTFDSPKLINMIGVALNVNDLPSTSLSYDPNSFMDEILLSTRSGTLEGVNQTYDYYDTSNMLVFYFVDILFSIDYDFQGGLSSPATNINFKLMGSLKSGVDLSTWKQQL